MARGIVLLRQSTVASAVSPATLTSTQHFLSLPFFIPLYPTLSKTYSAFLLTSPVNLLSLPVAATGGRFGSFLALGEIGTLPHTGKPPSWWHRAAVPSAILALAVNVVTQGICVRGVNRLTSVRRTWIPFKRPG